MQEIELKALIAATNSKIKAAKSKFGIEAKDAFGEAYHEACEHADEIRVHSVRGNFPTKLMSKKMPNETKEELDYRKAAFQSPTVSYWNKGISSMNRVFSEQNYTLRIEDDEDFAEYVKADFPTFGSVMNYFREVVSRGTINDPNAVLVADLGRLPLVVDEEGNFVVNDAEQLSPIGKVYPCEKVIEYVENHYAILVTEKKSLVYVGDRPKKEGVVYLIYDREQIVEVSQTGVKSDYKFEVTNVYEHFCEELPAWILKGLPSEEHPEIFDSIFSPALPYLNKAVVMDSTLDATITKHAYQTRWYYESDCVECDGKGKIADNSETADAGVYISCVHCSGTGKGIRFSPLTDYKLKLPASNVPDAPQVSAPGMGYVAPDPTILNFAKDKIANDIEKAFLFMNIDVTLSESVDAQTATKSKIDRDELFNFMLTFSNVKFQQFERFVRCIYSLRYNKPAFEAPIHLTKPIEFDLKTSSELSAEIGEAKKNGMPDFVQENLMHQYNSSRFYGNTNIEKRAQIVSAIDSLSTYTIQEIATLKAQGMIELWQVVLHVNMSALIGAQIAKKADFLEQEVADISVTLIAEAKALAAAMQPNSAANILNGVV